VACWNGARQEGMRNTCGHERERLKGAGRLTDTPPLYLLAHRVIAYGPRSNSRAVIARPSLCWQDANESGLISFPSEHAAHQRGSGELRAVDLNQRRTEDSGSNRFRYFCLPRRTLSMWPQYQSQYFVRFLDARNRLPQSERSHRFQFSE